MNKKGAARIFLTLTFLGAPIALCPMEATSCVRQAPPPCHGTRGDAPSAPPADGGCCGFMHLSQALTAPTAVAAPCPMARQELAAAHNAPSPARFFALTVTPASPAESPGTAPPSNRLSGRSPPAC